MDVRLEKFSYFFLIFENLRGHVQELVQIDTPEGVLSERPLLLGWVFNLN